MEVPAVAEDEGLFYFLKLPVSNHLEWVNLKINVFGKYLGASYEGYEDVTHLLVAIEARRN
jgi:hypothetical protein